MARQVAVIVGSLRRESLNRKMAMALAAMAPETLRLNLVEIGDLPLYNEDIDGETPPPSYYAFRQLIRASDAALFVTPEYNRSMSGAMKNALDVGSRPYGASAWSGKPAAVMTVSPGAIGGFGANHHLRQSLVFLDMPCMQQPEAYIGGAGDAFSPDGAFQTDGLRSLAQKFLDAFALWVERHARR